MQPRVSDTGNYGVHLQHGMDSMGSKISTVYSGCYYSLRKKSMVVFEKCLALFEVLQSTPR